MTVQTSCTGGQNEGLILAAGLCGQGVGTVVLEGAASFPAPVVSHLLGSSPACPPPSLALARSIRSVHGAALLQTWPISPTQTPAFMHGIWDSAYCDSTGMSPLGLPSPTSEHCQGARPGQTPSKWDSTLHLSRVSSM